MNFGVSCDNFLMLLVTGQQKVGKVKKKKELRGRCLPPQFYFFFLLFVWTNLSHLDIAQSRVTTAALAPDRVGCKAVQLQEHCIALHENER